MENDDEITETFPVVCGIPLRLSFTPEAIREHFDGDDDVESLTDEQLLSVGMLALEDDDLYAAFHEVLRYAVLAITGVRV